jgi:hypothetical protein
MTINENIYSDLLRLQSRISLLRLRVLLRLEQSCKAGFDPSQPRVPAGNSDGGQWTDTGGRSGTKPSRELGLGRGSHVRIRREEERDLAIHRTRARDRQKIIKSAAFYGWLASQTQMKSGGGWEQCSRPHWTRR